MKQISAGLLIACCPALLIRGFTKKEKGLSTFELANAIVDQSFCLNDSRSVMPSESWLVIEVARLLIGQGRTEITYPG